MNLPALSGMTVCNKQCSALKVTKVVGWDRGGGGGGLTEGYWEGMLARE